VEDDTHQVSLLAAGGWLSAPAGLSVWCDTVYLSICHSII